MAVKKSLSLVSSLLILVLLFVIPGECFAVTIGDMESLAISYIEGGKDADAVAAIDSLIADYSDDPYIVNTLNLIADRYWSNDKYSESNELKEEILARWPNHADVIPVLADLVGGYIGNNEFIKANDAVENLLVKYSDHPETDGVIELGEIAAWYWNKGKQAESNELKEEILTRWSGHSNAFPISVDLINGYIWNDEIAKAEAGIQKLQADYGNHPDIVENINMFAESYTYIHAVEHDKAIGLYQYILSKSLSQNWTEKASLHVDQLGILKLIKAGNDPNDVGVQDATNNLISQYGSHADLPEMVSLIGEQYYNDAFIKELEGKNELAKKYFKKAISMLEKAKLLSFPGTSLVKSDIYFVLGESYRRLGKYGKAVENYKYVADNGTNSGDVTFSLVKCYKKLKEAGKIPMEESKQKTIAVLEAAILKNPGFLQAHKALEYYATPAQGGQK